MAQKKAYYIVTGRGRFPEDMLRYDHATLVATGELPVLNVPAFLIYGYCTKGRWRSFIWSVWQARQRTPAGDSERGPVEWKVEVGPGHWETIELHNTPQP